jgi:hypothetical protein
LVTKYHKCRFSFLGADDILIKSGKSTAEVLSSDDEKHAGEKTADIGMSNLFTKVY